MFAASSARTAAGKTTLIRMITGLVRPGEGTIRIEGFDVQRDRMKALGQVGAIVESPIFFPYMSGRDNLLNLAKLHAGIPKEKRAARVDEVLATVGLDGRGHDKVKTYSLGMKQRLGIAQALLGNPKLIILDEPSQRAGSDGDSRASQPDFEAEPGVRDHLFRIEPSA